jgi:hypothetical protein
LIGLATGPILEQARSLQGWPIEGLPQALLERLSTQEAGLVAEITAQPEPPVRVPADCVAELRRLQLARERADIQRQMDRLLEQGIPSDDDRINELGMRQLALKQQIDAQVADAPHVAAADWQDKSRQALAGVADAALRRTSHKH